MSDNDSDTQRSYSGYGAEFLGASHVPHRGQGLSLTLRTYLVEDSEIIRTNLEEALLELGDAAVVAHADGEVKARHWLEVHPDDWDLAVVDLFLKEGSGLGLLRSQSRRAAEQKVVVLSNYATRDMRERCAQLGADAVFDKSTELDDMLAWCRSLQAPGDAG